MGKVIVILIVVIIVTSLIIYQLYLKPREVLVIFCAGSLYYPLSCVKKEFLNEHPNLKIVIEPSGSVIAMKKIVELKKRCDILALADYKLILNYVMPNYSKFCIVFATNELVLCYTNYSKFHDLINSTNWYEILMKNGVTLGFSNPNNDPAGYRTLIVLLLASFYYKKPIFNELIEKYSNIRYKVVNSTYVIEVPSNIVVNVNKIKLRSKSIDLISLLKEGTLDYAFEYKSVAIALQLNYIKLPREINLGCPDFAKNYEKVEVILLNGTSSKKVVKGGLIKYGLTIPTTAENVKYAIEFLNFLLSEKGKSILQSSGLQALSKPIVYGKLPKGLNIGVRI